MAYQNGSSKVAMATLSGLTALVLSLWVFDQILESVFPLLYTCAGNGTYSNITTCCVVGAVECAGAINSSLTEAGYFGTTLTFVNDLLPVIGIIAGYIMIRVAIKKMTF
jgi:hypothetical protein